MARRCKYTPIILVVLQALVITSISACRNQPAVKVKETILKQDLREMRRAIDQYAEDQKKLPQSLEDLVKEGYINAVPVDPITGKADWNVKIEEDTVSSTGGR